MADITAIIRASGVILLINSSTVRHWLQEMAIKPWQVRSWVFPPGGHSLRAGLATSAAAGVHERVIPEPDPTQVGDHPVAVRSGRGPLAGVRGRVDRVVVGGGSSGAGGWLRG